MFCLHFHHAFFSGLSVFSHPLSSSTSSLLSEPPRGLSQRPTSSRRTASPPPNSVASLPIFSKKFLLDSLCFRSDDSRPRKSHPAQSSRPVAPSTAAPTTEPPFTTIIHHDILPSPPTQSITIAYTILMLFSPQNFPSLTLAPKLPPINTPSSPAVPPLLSSLLQLPSLVAHPTAGRVGQVLHTGCTGYRHLVIWSTFSFLVLSSAV